LNVIFLDGNDKTKIWARRFKMGKYLKLGILIVSVIILIFIVIGAIIGVSNFESEQSTHQQSTASIPGKTQYDKIRVGDSKTGKGGMTLSEVEHLLGKPTTQTEGKTGNTEMDVYTFATNAGPNSVLVTFINGHASGKTQTGLK
jgi:hypothetical protein